VLDGLHEDLNRIKHKPAPVEMTPEREAALETLPPEVASEKEWQIYRMRNDSFIVDLFQGQYRNRLECLTCHKVSGQLQPSQSPSQSWILLKFWVIETCP
jgi:ubiquitin carboxyl-terminal hydrolase 8